MLLDKIDYLKLEACQKEALAIMGEFRRALLKHFDVVTKNSTRLIRERWDNNGQN